MPSLALPALGTSRTVTRIQRCRRESGSLVRSFLNLLEWEFCWYSDATADHLGERI